MERDYIPLSGWNGKQPYQINKELITTLEEIHRKQNFVTLKKKITTSQLGNTRLAKCYFIFIFYACISILSILIVMGVSIQFPKLESEIRFGWGISYNYIGQNAS